MMLNTLSLPGGPGLFHLLVWPHGLQYLDEIIHELELMDGVKVRHVSRTDGVVLKRLVSQVYSLDSVPVRHLAAKLSGLLTRGRRGSVVHVFFSIADPRYVMTGSGDFRHSTSEVIERFKKTVRMKFNPRNHDGEPTHDHVIHCSDNPLQARKLADAVSDGFSPDEPRGFDRRTLGAIVPNHLGSVAGLDFEWVPLTSLRARVWVGKQLKTVELDDTPHYSFLAESALYHDYISQRRGLELTDGHSAARFRALYDSIKTRGLDAQKPILVHQDGAGSMVIVDGTHRAVCAAKLGIERVRVAILKRTA